MLRKVPKVRFYWQKMYDWKNCVKKGQHYVSYKEDGIFGTISKNTCFLKKVRWILQQTKKIEHANNLILTVATMLLIAAI